LPHQHFDVEFVTPCGGVEPSEFLQVQRPLVDEDRLIVFGQGLAGWDKERRRRRLTSISRAVMVWWAGAALVPPYGFRRRAAGKRAADPLAPLVRAQTMTEVLEVADPIPVDVPGFGDVAGLERVVDDLFQQIERGGVGRVFPRRIPQAAQKAVTHGGMDGIP